MVLVDSDEVCTLKKYVLLILDKYILFEYDMMFIFDSFLLVIRKKMDACYTVKNLGIICYIIFGIKPCNTICSIKF